MLLVSAGKSEKGFSYQEECFEIKGQNAAILKAKMSQDRV